MVLSGIFHIVFLWFLYKNEVENPMEIPFKMSWLGKKIGWGRELLNPINQPEGIWDIDLPLVETPPKIPSRTKGQGEFGDLQIVDHMDFPHRTAIVYNLCIHRG